jgi:hypothetical protein
VPVVAFVAWRRSVHRCSAVKETKALDQQERHLAEIHADAIARRLKIQQPWK